MKKVLWIILIIVVIGLIIWFVNSNQSMEVQEDPVTISPVSHASFVMNWSDTIVYVDPVGGEEAYLDYSTPDIVFLTHTHGDHLDTDTLNSVIDENTTIIAPQIVADELGEDLNSQTTVMANGDSLEEMGINVEAIPMYNLPESDEAYHVKGDGNGYVLESNDYRLYIAGDTSGIPEMRSLENIDAAFIPMNLPYTMDIEEAADAVLDFAPDTVYPYHYRGNEGFSDVDRFKELVNEENSDIGVVVLNWYPEEESN